MEFLGNRVKTG